jgi:hypothetical protein
MCNWSPRNLLRRRKKRKKKRRKKKKLDYDIKWRVLTRKEPIINNVISRSEFRFASLCRKAKEQTQIHINKKKKDA